MTTATTEQDTIVDEARRISRWPLEKIAAVVGGRLTHRAAADRTPTAVSTDTRNLADGQLFVALRGENFDAHNFVTQASKQGACAAIVEHELGAHLPLPLIVVEDSLQALTDLGCAIWREAAEEGLHTIDVTGSNGKTTVKEMLALLWGMHGEVFATPGNLNNHIGVPLVLCDLPAKCDHLILEMGANAPDEISHLISLAPGSERIITSIGTAHIEGFGGVDGIRRGKSEIFERADAQTTAIMPHSERDNLIDEAFPGRVVTVGFEDEADVCVRELDSEEATADVQRFEISFEGRTWTICLPIPGAHQGLNAGTSIATLLARGREPVEDLCNVELAALSLPAGRWRVVDAGDFRFIDDAYNANPSSVQASFDAFMGTTDAQDRSRVAIIGEMLELGDDAEDWHLQVASKLAAHRRLDALVAVGPHAARMAEAARANGADALDAVGFDSVDAAAQWLADRPASFVFLKGSRGARLERIVDLVASSVEKQAGGNV